MTDDPAETGAGADEAGPVSVADTTAYGLTLTFVGAVLLALAYYGYRALEASRRLGEAVPEPFYLLGIAVLFVVELLNSRQLGLLGVGRAIALAGIYGALLVFAIEGGAYLWADPDVALENFQGLTVFAAALVVAALCYVGYLAVRDAVG